MNQKFNIKLSLNEIFNDESKCSVCNKKLVMIFQSYDYNNNSHYKSYRYDNDTIIFKNRKKLFFINLKTNLISSNSFSKKEHLNGEIHKKCKTCSYVMSYFNYAFSALISFKQNYQFPKLVLCEINRSFYLNKNNHIFLYQSDDGTFFFINNKVFGQPIPNSICKKSFNVEGIYKDIILLKQNKLKRVIKNIITLI